MRTIVVYYTPGALKVCELEDVVSPLARGNYRTDETGRYQIAEVEEFLGVTRATDGRTISGNEKLLCLLSSRFDQQKAAALLLTMEYVGSRPCQRVGPSGLVLTGSTMLDDFDNVVLVVLNLVRGRGEMKTSLTDLLSAAELALTQRTAAVKTLPASEATGVAPIKIEEGAAQ